MNHGDKQPCDFRLYKRGRLAGRARTWLLRSNLTRVGAQLHYYKYVSIDERKAMVISTVVTLVYWDMERGGWDWWDNLAESLDGTFTSDKAR